MVFGENQDDQTAGRGGFHCTGKGGYHWKDRGEVVTIVYIYIKLVRCIDVLTIGHIELVTTGQIEVFSNWI